MCIFAPMKYIPRNIDRFLIEWKSDSHRKPLLLRGARQVGKSSSIRHFAHSFSHFLEINLEKRPEAMTIFQSSTDVHEIAERLAMLTDVPIVEGETLLFIDEIQICPAAIKALRYFKEDFPGLHVVAAGSLLEFALAELPSFGVGRISSLFMYPLSFSEFLTAIGRSSWKDALDRAGIDSPIFPELHSSLIEAFRSYLLVGGMPESAAAWVESRSYLKCAEIQEDIQQSYFDDFAKYSRKVSPELLRATLRSVVSQNGKKFVYTRGLESYKASEVKQALEMLSMAGLIYEVNMSASNGLPLGAEVNPKFKKYIFIDPGLLLRIQNMDMGADNPLENFILTSSPTDLVNKGAMAEMFVGLELIKSGNPRLAVELYYWENLSRGATAEVDFVAAWNMAVLPIEVKAGVSGKMKSLNLFMQSKSLSLSVRTSLENFGKIEINKEGVKLLISIIPLYAIFNYRRYLGQLR